MAKVQGCPNYLLQLTLRKSPLTMGAHECVADAAGNSDSPVGDGLSSSWIAVGHTSSVASEPAASRLSHDTAEQPNGVNAAMLLAEMAERVRQMEEKMSLAVALIVPMFFLLLRAQGPEKQRKEQQRLDAAATQEGALRMQRAFEGAIRAGDSEAVRTFLPKMSTHYQMRGLKIAASIGHTSIAAVIADHLTAIGNSVNDAPWFTDRKSALMEAVGRTLTRWPCFLSVVRT